MVSGFRHLAKASVLTTCEIVWIYAGENIDICLRIYCVYKLELEMKKRGNLENILKFSVI